MTVKIPDLTYYSVSVAKKTCKSMGIDIEIMGDEDSIIYSQYPAADTIVEKSSAKILAYTDKVAQAETVTVPDVMGMTAVAANQTLIDAGLNIRILGTKNYLSGTGATVVAQSLPKGTEVPRGTVIEVTFLYLDDSD